MKISVTQEHIDKGKRSDCGACPVALAIREQTRFETARVTGGSWGFGVGSKGRYYRLPSIVERFVMTFDYGSKVNPFEFELEVPA